MPSRHWSQSKDRAGHWSQGLCAGNAGAARPQSSSDRDLPRFFLPRASVPDYLDTTGIIRRSGTNQLIASPTGIWGVRVSVGVTEALGVALAKQMPDAVIEMAGPANDAGAAAAMTRAADQVAENIAVTVRQELSGAPPQPIP